MSNTLRFRAPSSPPGTVSWGDIAGTLSNQTDLQAVLDTKVYDGKYSIVSLTEAVPIWGSVKKLSLLNDLASPGNSKYYGTDLTGTKGWYTLPGTLQDGQFTKSILTTDFVDSITTTNQYKIEIPASEHGLGLSINNVVGYQLISGQEYKVVIFDDYSIDDSTGLVTIFVSKLPEKAIKKP